MLKFINAVHRDPSIIKGGIGFAEEKVVTLPLNSLVSKIMRLSEVMSEKKHYPYQQDFMWTVAENAVLSTGEDITCMFARQSGKSQCSGDLAVALCIALPMFAELFPEDNRLNIRDEQGNYRGFNKGFNIGIYAPTLAQAQRTLTKVKNTLSTSNSQKILRELGITWDVSNGKEVVLVKKNPSGFTHWKSVVACATAAPKAKIEGDTHNLIIMEEGQDLDDYVVNKSIFPMLGSTNGCSVRIGTAGNRKCEFLKSIKRNLQREMDNPALKVNFNFVGDVCARYNSFFRNHLEKMKDILGEDSEEYQMSYNNKWFLDRGMFVTEDRLLNDQVAPRDGVFSNLLSPQAAESMLGYNYSIVAGVDFASVNDATVLTIMAVDWMNPLIDTWITDPETGATNRVMAFEKHIINWLELSGVDYEYQFFEIRDFLKQYKRLVKVAADTTGVGLPIFHRLCAEFEGLNVVVEPCIMSRKNASEMFRLFSSDIYRKRVTFPYSDMAKRSSHVRKFRWQMLEAEKDIDSLGYLVVKAPDESGAHDDYVDSACIACHAAQVPVNLQSTKTVSGVNLFSRKKHTIARRTRVML
jgi:hypothetical protein